MKNWRVEHNELIMLGDSNVDYDDHIVSITKESDGSVTFTENCDNYFSVTMSKTEAIQALQEAIAWLESEL